MQLTTPVEHFSDSYYVLPNVTVEPYVGDKFVASTVLHQGLENTVGTPLARIGNDHYWLDAEWTIPSETVAVPKDSDAEAGNAVLLTKPHATRQMLDDGLIDRPG